jgi:hypothetical protein
MKTAPQVHLAGGRPRSVRMLRRLLRLLFVGLLLMMIWPYVDLWRLNRLVLQEPPSALSRLVDIDSVREQILRRLNKDTDSQVGDVSDPFIEWIERGMRTPGNERLRETVTLHWLHQLLSAQGVEGRGFLPAVRYAFFEPPDGFLVRIGGSDGAPVWLRMGLGLLGWRVTAVYY